MNAAFVAFREMGTNAIPALLNVIQSRGPPFQKMTYSIVNIGFHYVAVDSSGKLPIHMSKSTNVILAVGFLFGAHPRNGFATSNYVSQATVFRASTAKAVAHVSTAGQTARFVAAEIEQEEGEK